MPFVIAMLVVVLLVAYLPPLSLFVPHLIFGK
jgi:TRAP-type C4-dicarboxylate transport system permease large subunit